MSLVHTVLINNFLKITLLKNNEFSLADIKRDRETGAKVESVIAIYSCELKLFSDVINLLVKRAIFHKQISSLDEVTELTTELITHCVSEFKTLSRIRG